ncbi:MAG: glycine zipper 2TM domain-containing protein [Marinobacterium sp.]|nr:glycine zipper 2TM domain-containing protein [Marinobacterium sp.]
MNRVMIRFTQKTLAVTLASIVVLGLAGCSGPSLTGRSYSASEARYVQTVNYGVVQSVELVVIEGRTDGVVGTGAGAIIGGIAGSNIGGGRGQDIATVLGAIAGGVAGNKLEESATRKQGQEITIRLENGRVISVVQQVDETGMVFQPGQRVRVLEQNNTVRVVSS